MERVQLQEALARSRAARSVHGGEGADLAGVTSERTAVATTAVKETAPGVARRTGRGHVDSFGDGRTCSSPGCPTKLSRYNGSAVCAVHDGSRKG
jgi:hypothetical protein